MKPIYFQNGGIRFTILTKNNKYHLDFYKPDGKRVRRSTKKQATADNLIYIKKVLIPDIIIALGQEPTTQEHGDTREWTLESYAETHFGNQIGKNRPQTIRTKQQHYQNHIYPFFGKRFLSTISSIELKQWQSQMMTKINPTTQKKYKIQTIITYRSVFYSIMEEAKGDQLIDRNPFENVPNPKLYTNLPVEQLPKEIHPFTQQEINKILAHATGYMKNFIKLILNTGIRPGEAIALEWGDINYDRRTIDISKTLSRAVENDPKTKNSNREIDMLKKAKEALQDQYLLTKDQQKIFMSMFHKPFFSSDIIAKLFKEMLIEIGIPTRPLYNLRHTFASQAITKGVNILWVSRMLGHKDVNITLQVYAKFIVEDDHIRLKNIEKLDRIL